MHLAQHHFQMQNAYVEQVAGAALSQLFAAPYGLLGCDLEESALRNDLLAVRSAWGIMPDGTPFSFPDEPTPEPLALGAVFSPTRSSHLVLLALPAEQPGRANCDSSADGAAVRSTLRFSAVERAVADETTGIDFRPVRIARKNFRLLLDEGVPDGLVTLPIARIQRDGSGHFALDAKWVGPSLRISASPRLQELVARLEQMLNERAAAMVAERRSSAGAAEYASREVLSFWFLHALNSAIPRLRHFRRTGSVHPEQLHQLMAQLAGALCTFSLTSTPLDLPAYDHDDPEACFAALERHIRGHLDVIFPSAAIALPVRPVEPSFFSATVTDPRCFGPRAHWFLGIRSTTTGSDVVAKAPRLVKVCSAKHISRLANEGLSGLALEHVAAPSPDLSPRLGTHYFSVRRVEPCWKSIVDTGEVGLYVPAALPDAEIELKVVLERRD